jgi:hypothetical protein
MKTRLVLAGKPKAEIIRATAAALDKKELPVLEPGAKSWGAELPGSPILAADDSEERVTILWSRLEHGPMGPRLRTDFRGT